MKLKIPTTASSNTQASIVNVNANKEIAQETYTVRRGDTLWKIARSYGVSPLDLARWNNITTHSRLYPGDKLKIYYN
jgi:membrane-bound lytic murein transglycosylase D